MPPPDARRGRGAAAVRGRDGGRLRRDDRGGRRRRAACASAPRARGTRRSRSATRASSPRTRRPPGRPTSFATTGTVGGARVRRWPHARQLDATVSTRALAVPPDAARPRRRGAPARRRRCAGGSGCGVAALAAGRDRRDRVRPLDRRGARDHAAAPPRGHHPPAGREKDLDPALIAAVIYAESRFRDQTSHAGREGLMQITPATARHIAPPVGRHDLRATTTSPTPSQHRLRDLLPALPARPLRRQRGRGARRLQRAGTATPTLGRRGAARRRHPVPRDARVCRRRCSRSATSTARAMAASSATAASRARPGRRRAPPRAGPGSAPATPRGAASRGDARRRRACASRRPRGGP